ncbi:MAG: hypothetical protein OEV64_00585 [Desulfobulbaceae bacterium]|nr:hypothetical protein [Desulfobulbaceae bacterium]
MLKYIKKIIHSKTINHTIREVSLDPSPSHNANKIITNEWSEDEQSLLMHFRNLKPTAISIVPPDWRGVTSATRNLVSNLLPIDARLNPSQVERTARFIYEIGCKKIFFGGFAHSYSNLVNTLHKNHPDIDIYVFWLSSFLQSNEDYAWHSFKLIDQLCRERKIKKWGFAKKGMAEVIRATGVPAEFIMSYVRTIPDAPSIPKPGGPHLAVWALAPIWRKNPYAMLAAASTIPGADVFVVGQDERAREFANYLNLSFRYQRNPIDQDQMQDALAENHLNLYVTLSECSPMLPLESLSAGAPCLFGPNSHLFEDNPYLHSRLVVPYPDRSDIIAEFIQRGLEERDEIISVYRKYTPGYNQHAMKSLTDFLEIDEASIL